MNKPILIVLFATIASSVMAQAKEEEVWVVVEESAVPAGGMHAFYKAISEHMNYPKKAREAGIEGRVFVEFVVDTTGSLTDVRVIKGIGHGCDEEAVRVIQESSKSVKWHPGKQRGKSVKQRFTLPLTFNLGIKK